MSRPAYVNRAIRHERRATLRRVGSGIAVNSALVTRKRQSWVHQRNVDHETGEITTARVHSTVDVSSRWFAVPWRRVCSCGSAREDVQLAVGVGADGDSYAFARSGLLSCASVWLCPVCAAKIRHRRTLDTEHLARWHAGNGGSLVMLTLTLRHSPSDGLRRLRVGLNEAFRSLQRTEQWRHVRSQCVGVVHALEVTHSFAGTRVGNGWHPHLHILLLVRESAEAVAGVAPAAAGIVDYLNVEGLSLWSGSVVAQLGERHRPMIGAGFDARVIGSDAAAYVTKISREVTRGDLKSGIRLPWSIIDAMGAGAAWATPRWIEYADGMRGANAVRWSPGLRDACGLGPVQSDAAIAAGVEVVESADVQLVPAPLWNRWFRAVCPPGTRPEYLLLLERIERLTDTRGLSRAQSAVLESCSGADSG